MWTALKIFTVRAIRLIARALVWWIEKLGETPCLSRDPGFLALRWSARPTPAQPPADPAGITAEAIVGELVPRPDQGPRGGSTPEVSGRRRMTPIVRARRRRQRDAAPGAFLGL